MINFEELLERSDGIKIANRDIESGIEAHMIRQSQQLMIEKANLAEKTVMTTCDTVISILDGADYVMTDMAQVSHKIRHIVERILMMINCCIQAERMIRVKVRHHRSRPIHEILNDEAAKFEV